MQIVVEKFSESTVLPEVLLYFVKEKAQESLPIPMVGSPAELIETISFLADKHIFQGKKGQTHLFPWSAGGNQCMILLVGLGTTDSLNTLKEASAEAARSLRKHAIERVGIQLPLSAAGFTSHDQFVQAIVEGYLLGNYVAPTYRKKGLSHSDQAEIRELTLLYKEEDVANQSGTASFQKLAEQAAYKAQVIAIATNKARDWINEPGNQLTPAKLAQEALEVAQAHQLDVEVLDEEQIKSMGMNALYSVGKGSKQPPRCVVIKYEGDPSSNETIGLVGKGITFDTGGISLKGAAGMERMIDDMGGASAVLATMDIIGKLRPAVNVVAVIPSAENMPSGSALKPGDVIDTLSGKTIEVINTDAEGRLVLADGVSLAIKRGATRIIDVATLTGAVVVALGKVTTGALTNDEAFLQQLLKASEQTGEKIWQLPAFDEYRELLKSDVADVRNSCGRHAGAITGGLFIEAFVDDIPWIHLDIAGTVYLSSAQGVHSKGGTGVMVRTLAEYLCDI